MQLQFTKMHGTGNDFVVLDLISQHYKPRAEDIRRLADRHYGIGCDQVLVVEAPRSPDVDFRYRIFNSNGEEVEQCGNGARCFARFVREKQLTSKRVITVQTNTGVLTLQMRNRSDVEVNMGVPELEPAKIPFSAGARQRAYPLQVDGKEYEIGAVSMGNPHAVLRVKKVDRAPVATLGPLIERHKAFPRRVNAGFMQVISDRHIKLRVFERGVGETRACGSGACAAVVYGSLRGWLRDTVTVELPGGKLSVAWGGEGEPVRMTGPTEIVFEGSIKI
ncbi:MAG: diaminopimelate epimerase [Halioglobus sp.]|nr:diaminopimelate epimerase [Halioglobus sp.]